MRTIVTRTCFIARLRPLSERRCPFPHRPRPPTPEAFVTPAVGGSARGHVSLLAAALQAASQAVPLRSPRRRRWAPRSPSHGRRGGQAGDREQPRYSDRPRRSADRGSERRRGARRVGTVVHIDVSEQQHSASLRQHLHRQPGSQLQTGHLQSNLGVEQRLPWGAHLRRGLGQLAIGEQQQRQHVEAAAQLLAVVQLPAVADARLVHRQHPPTAAGESEESRDCRRRSSADAGVSTTRTVRNAYCNLAYAVASLGVAAAVARPRQRVASQHALTRRDRHHPSDRHRRSGIRSRGARGSGHRRPGTTSPPPKTRCARSCSIRRCRTSGTSASSRPSCRRFNRLTVDIDAAVRNALERRTDLAADEAFDGSDRGQHPLLPQRDAAGRAGQCELRPDGARRHHGSRPRAFLGFQSIPRRTTAPRSRRAMRSVLGDLFGLNSPSWTATLNISYPIGTSSG